MNKKQKMITFCSIAVLLTAAALASVKLFKPDKEQAVSVSSADSQQQKIEVKKPIFVENDTDDERIYGTDVLYHHDGLSIKLIGSENDNITLLFENENDKEYSMFTDYVVANSASIRASTIAIVEAGGSEERTLGGLTDQLPDDDVYSLCLRFEFYDEFYDEHFFSEPINIVYQKHEDEYIPKETAVLVYEDENIRIYNNSARYYADKTPDDDYDDEKIVMWCYYENKCEDDLSVYVDSVQLIFDDGSLSDMYGMCSTRLPAGTIGTDNVTIRRPFGEEDIPIDRAVSVLLRYEIDHNDGQSSETAPLDAIDISYEE